MFCGGNAGEVVPLMHNDLVVGLTNASAPKPHLRPLCNALLRRHRRQAVGWKCTEIVWESDGVRHLAPGSMLVIQARHIYC